MSSPYTIEVWFCDDVTKEELFPRLSGLESSIHKDDAMCLNGVMYEVQSVETHIDDVKFTNPLTQEKTVTIPKIVYKVFMVEP